MSEVLLAQRIGALERRIAELETVETAVPRPVIAKKDSAQTINNATTTTVIFNVEVLDVDFQYNPPTGVFTALRNGVYQVTSALLYDATATLVCAENINFSVFVAGVLWFYLDRKDDWACGGTEIFPHLSGTALVCATAGQTIDVRTYQASGGNLPLYVADASLNYLNILRVAPYNP